MTAQYEELHSLYPFAKKWNRMIRSGRTSWDMRSVHMSLVRNLKGETTWVMEAGIVE
jgi:hypothetical protein